MSCCEGALPNIMKLAQLARENVNNRFAFTLIHSRVDCF